MTPRAADTGGPYGAFRKDEAAGAAWTGVRVLALAVLVALSGCLSGPADGPAVSTGPSPAVPIAEPPLIVEVLNTTVDIPAPGGATEASFDVPEGYLELFIATPGEVVLRGQVRIALTDPAGTEHVLIDGAYVQGDTTVIGCPDPCTFRLEPVPGTWHLEASATGEVHLSLTGRAQ